MARSQMRQGSTRFVEAERQAMAAYGLSYRNHFLDLDRPRLRARVIEAGEGEPLLLVHGALAVAAQWAPLMAELTGHRILAVDLPGYGLTDPFVYERGRLRQVAVEFLDAVLDGLGLESVPVVANSMGGLWTFWMSLDRPSRLEAIAQVGCPAMLLETSAPLSMRLLSVRGLNRRVLRVLPTPDGRGQLRQMGDGAAAETAPPEFLALLEASDDPEPFWPASLSLLEAAARLGGGRVQLTEAELARVRQPTVFVWGADDPFGSPSVGERAASVVPRAHLVRVDGGHLPWVGQPAAVAGAIRDHLQQATTDGG